MGQKRRNFSSAFKARVAMEALKERETLAQLASKFDVHPNQITQWKTQLLEQASTVFEQGAASKEPSVDIKTLHAKIGELALENDFLEGALTKAGLLSAKK